MSVYSTPSVASSQTAAIPAEGSLGRNDFSNPQQGTATPLPPNTAQRPSLAIPIPAKDCRKLFVGGLPCDITNDEFRVFFQQFGTIVDSVVMFDYETKRSRGFGFVTFQDPNVASALLAMNIENTDTAPGVQQTGRMEMRGKIIEIKTAEPKEGWNHRKHKNHNNGARHHQKQFSPEYLPYYNMQMDQGTLLYDPVMGLQSFYPYSGYGYVPNDTHAGMAYSGGTFPYPTSVPQFTDYGAIYATSPETTTSIMYTAVPERLELNKTMAN